MNMICLQYTHCKVYYSIKKTLEPLLKSTKSFGLPPAKFITEREVFKINIMEVGEIWYQKQNDRNKDAIRFSTICVLIVHI